MSAEIISILVLLLVFIIATVLPVHMGALALIASFLVGTIVVGESADDIVAGFPGDLFVILAGITYLFAIATNNGTVDWLVHMAVRAVRGRIILIPWVMFAVSALVTAVGAVVPAAIAVIAPVAMGFATRYRINPVLMGLFVVTGGIGGSFSPISIFGSITNGILVRNHLPGDPTMLFILSFLANLLLALVVFLVFDGRELLERRHESISTIGTVSASGETVQTESVSGEKVHGAQTHASNPGGTGGSAVATLPASDTGDDGSPDHQTLNRDKVLTLLGLLVLAIGALGFDLDIGFTAIGIAVVLSLFCPTASKNAVSQIAWPTVLLISGIVTYVSLMERIGTIDYLGDQVARIGAPLLGAFIICLIGAVVSAFASTTGLLGALIPLAVPFLTSGDIGVVGLISALAVSSSVVDASPFSTTGALIVANAPEERREYVFSSLMRWGFSMVVVAPVATWLVLVVPGWF